MKVAMRHSVAFASCLIIMLATSYADPQGSSAGNAAFGSSSGKTSGDSGTFGIGVKTSLLGVGAEVAVRVTHHSNVRAGVNVLGYSDTFRKDGINYGAHLNFQTFEAHYDVFPWAGNFHVSAGMLGYKGNPITANAIVPGNQNFTLGGQIYYSNPSSPATASGRVNFNQYAPTVTFGWGNLVHRNSKHFSIPVEFGVAYQGSPKTTLNLTGNVCDAASTTPGVSCISAANSTVQSNVVSEQVKINKGLAPFKMYPIISVGFGYKF